MEVDPRLVIPNPALSIVDGAIEPWARASTTTAWYARLLEAVGEVYGFDTGTPIEELSKKALQVVLFGSEEPIVVRYRSQSGAPIVTKPPTRAWSRTSRVATRKPTRTGYAARSSDTWRPCPAPIARAHACGRSRWPSE